MNVSTMNNHKPIYYRFLKLLICAACCGILLTGCKDKEVQPGNDPAVITAADTSETGEGSAAATPAVTEAAQAEFVDYASELKLDMSSDTVKTEATVKSFVDGDTTHFYVPETVTEDGVLKARYIAINTPESTGKIEEYGKKASNFTKEKLSKATSIIIESDDGSWDLDSTGGRYLVWIWYRTDESADYRNLNIEILQNGLAIASSSANNRYGSVCTSAIANAKAMKLNVYSGQPDPDFFYGDAIELTLKELRTHLENYNGSKVAFEGIITRNSNNGIYIEEYDEETNGYYGIYVYYGFSLSGEGLDILTVGNRSRIVGTVQYYETGGTYQVSGLTYRQMKPDDPGNIRKISDGHEAPYPEISADTFVNGTVTVDVDDETVTYPYAELAMDTAVMMKNLEVTDIYTTSNEESSSFGAMTLTCTSDDGLTVVIRTDVLYDEDKNLITEDEYLRRIIDVKGIVGIYDGNYQIKVLSAKDITIKN